MGENAGVKIPLRHRFTPPVRPKRWRFWLGTFVILLAWAIVGTILSLIVLPFTGVDFRALLIDGDVFGAFPGWGFLLFALVSFIPFAVATLLCYRYLLGQPIGQLFAVGVPFRWARVWWGFVTWGVIMGAPTFVALILFPGDYRWNFALETFLPYAIVALLLLPIQTTAEELFFRGWLLQWFSQRFSSIWMLSLLSGVTFSLPHLANPEAAGALLPAFLGYGMIGFVLGWVTIRDRSLEIAIGAHAANNLFASLVVGYEGGALPAEGLWVANEFEWGMGSLITLVLIPLFVVASRWGYQKRPPTSAPTENVGQAVSGG